MTRKLGERVEEALEAILGLGPEDRATALERLEGDDAEVAREVSRRLAAGGAQASDDGLRSLTHPEPWVTGDEALLPGDLAPGSLVGPWRLLEEIGEGGMGRVYRAERSDGAYERSVALKLLRRGLGDPRRESRFRGEQQILAGLEHPGIARLYDAGVTDDGRPWIAMELVAGVDLVEHCRREGLGLEARVRLVERVCQAVRYAHAQGIVHRDLKPSNILIVERQQDEGPRPVVVDFGIARVQGQPGTTRTGHLVGTPGYIAPEQLAGDLAAVDHRVDVFALGVILYQLVTGSRPFEAPSARQEMLRLLGGEPERPRRRAPHLPRDLETIILGALEREPDRRYPSAAALGEDLRRFLDGQPPLRQRVGPIGRMARRGRRHPLIAASVAAAVLLISGLSLRIHLVSAAAEERARVAQRFGAEAERIDAQMRIAHLAPPHDIRPHRQRLRGQLDELAREMERLGGVAHAPRLLALGRGHLALGEPEPARRYLEEAWDSGERSQEVAVSLARALAQLYRSAQVEAQRIADAEAREARLSEIDRELRSPALALLRGVEEEGRPVPGLLQAQIAVWESRFEEALQGSEVARQEAPWLYEAWILEGDAHFAQASTSQARETEDRIAALERAEAAYARATEVGSSDPRSWEALCQAAMRRLEMGFYERGEALDPYYQRIEEACGQALEIDPERLSTLTWRSRARNHWARYLLRRGQDPGFALASAREDAERVLELDPTAVEALRALADTLVSMADAALERRLPRGGEVEEAMELLERATSLAPADAGLWNSLGLAWWSRLEAAQQEGGDPLPALERAIESFATAASLRPGYSHALSNRGALLRQRMDHQVGQGVDPRPTFEEARESFLLALEANPGNSYAMNNLGNLHRAYGKWLRDQGSDPFEELEQALGLYARAGSVNPAWSTPRINSGLVEVDLALAAVDRGSGDPAAHFDRAEASFHEAHELRPGFASALLVHAQAVVARAEWEASAGISPRATVARAHHVLREARALDPQEPLLVELAARLAAL